MSDLNKAIKEAEDKINRIGGCINAIVEHETISGVTKKIGMSLLHRELDKWIDTYAGLVSMKQDEAENATRN